MPSYIDKEFASSNRPVMALVTSRNATYIVCRGEGAAREIRNHLQEMASIAVLSPEAWRVIPDVLKKAGYHISSDSILKLPETTLGTVVLALTQNASGSPTHRFLGEQLQAAALKGASQKGRSA